MYAIVELGGRQWKVEPGSRLEVNRLDARAAGEYVLDRVLFAYDGKQPQVGKPYISGAKIVCEVLAHTLGPKTIAYHFRRRENWRKTRGHRQPLTQLVVRSISCGGLTASEQASAKAARPKAAESKAAPSTAPKAAAPAKAASGKTAARTSVIKPQLKSLTKKPAARGHGASGDTEKKQT